MKKRTYSKKVSLAVIEMYRDGCRQKDIARSLGLSRYQVYRITGTCDFFMPEDPAASSETQLDDDLLSPKMSIPKTILREKDKDRQKENYLNAIDKILETVKMSRNKRFKIGILLDKLRNL